MGNTLKQIEIIRKRNIELQKQLEEVQNQLKLNLESENDYTKKIKELIVSFEEIQKEWILALDNLKESELEYDRLIEELKIIRKIFIEEKYKQVYGV